MRFMWPFSEFSGVGVPPGAFGLAWTLWSWQTGLWWLGVPLGILCELSFLTNAKRAWGAKEWERIWDLSAALFFVFAVYLLVSRENGIGILDMTADRGSAMRAGVRGGRAWLRLLQGLPVVLSPMLLAQLWSKSGLPPYRAFSWYLRKYPAWFDDERLGLRMDFSWVSIGLIGVGAALGAPSKGLFAGLAFLMGYLFLFQAFTRERKSWAASVMVFASCVAMAWWGQKTLHPVSAWWQRLEAEWIARWMGNRLEGQESRTWMGEIGSRKTSGRIVMQIAVPEGTTMPRLLREASFDTLQGRTWVNLMRNNYQILGGLPVEAKPSTAEEEPVDDGSDEVWVLSEERGTNRFRVWLREARDGVHLPVPAGMRRFESLAAIRVETNQAGSIRVIGWQSPNFEVVQDGSDMRLHGGTPTRFDQFVPDNESIAIGAAVQEAGMSTNLTVRQNLDRLASYFSKNFAYALWQPGARPRGAGETALSRFLRTTRKGHCEYFASASALILRKMGIPTRYVVGWSVDEPVRGGIEVRARHAHAWTMAWIDGSWRELDFTPPGWAEVELGEKPWWEPVTDLFGRFVFAFQKFRYQKAEWRQWLLIPAVLLVISAAIPLLRSRNAGDKAVVGLAGAGMDSPFFDVMSRWTETHGKPEGSETLRHWWRRIQPLEKETSEIEALLKIHEQIRFDPDGVSQNDRNRLREGVLGWTSRNPVQRRHGKRGSPG